MAKNWKVGEAVKAIKEGNKEDILDIGRRFPLFANLAAQVNEAGVAMLECVPDYCTARKIESVLKGDVQESESEDEAQDDEEVKAEKKPAKKVEKKQAKAKQKEEDDDEDEEELETKTAKELYDMCKKAGLKVKPKQDKSVYIEALKDAEDNETEDEDWDDDVDEKPAKKPAKKAEKKPAKAKQKEADDEDDEDWEI